MPRNLPIGNGSLLVCFDDDYQIRDLTFPHVGQENHLNGSPCRLGVWVDGVFAWVNSDWERELLYEPDTLVTKVSLAHRGLAIGIHAQDAVDFHENLLVRRFAVENRSPEPREIRLFFSHALQINGNSVGDTAAFDPRTRGVVHYKRGCYFLVNAATPEADSLHQFAMGQSGVGWKEGTYRDAEDGRLSGNPIAQGSVDSVIAIHLRVDGHGRGEAFYWLAAGSSWEDVRRLDALVRHKGVSAFIARTADYWRLWVSKEDPPLHVLPPRVRQLYGRSLLILRTQIDWGGGIVAANDSDVIAFNRDTYAYVWPRDGALVAHALGLAGYPVPARKFFDFMAQRMEKEGYFLHKYNPDGTLASSWHPWYLDGKPQLPIQEDETALVVWALWHHFVRYRDLEFIKPLYRPVIKRAAEFMSRYRDPETGLPGPSYDLWEERYGVSSFAVGAVFGGLTAASLFCRVFGETDKAERYARAAAEVREGATRFLWQEDAKCFAREITRDAPGKFHVDLSLDASHWGLFAFGLYEAVDPKIRATMEKVREALWVKTPVGGLARYENDAYYRMSEIVAGNPWFVCTLWLADYLIESSRGEEGLDEALAVMTWVADHALPSGVLAEQVHPETGTALSVSPLTWSHATFVATTQKLVHRLSQLRTCPQCGASSIRQQKRANWMERLYGDACAGIRKETASRARADGKTGTPGTK